MTLYWTKENKYYKLFEQATLFGTIDIICVWGYLAALQSLDNKTKERFTDRTSKRDKD